MTDSLLVQATNPFAKRPLCGIVPANEPERLAALHRYQVLDTPAEVAFDRLTPLAARLFKMPTVLISLVDESRAWFKSSIGFNAPEVRRSRSLASTVRIDASRTDATARSGFYGSAARSVSEWAV